MTPSECEACSAMKFDTQSNEERHMGDLHRQLAEARKLLQEVVDDKHQDDFGIILDSWLTRVEKARRALGDGK